MSRGPENDGPAGRLQSAGIGGTVGTETGGSVSGRRRRTEIATGEGVPDPDRDPAQSPNPTGSRDLGAGKDDAAGQWPNSTFLLNKKHFCVS